jgi:small subunit ribosomal protein S15
MLCLRMEIIVGIQELATLLRQRDENIDIEAYVDVTRQAAEIEVPYERIAELKLLDAERIASRPTPVATINAKAAQIASQSVQRHRKDHGSPEVQVIVAHEKVKYLTKHCIENNHDYATKRGLQAWVSKRRKMLNYLYTHVSKEKALKLAESLNIRFKPPRNNQHIAIKYRSFTNTKQGRKERGKPKKSTTVISKPSS